jgi:hypothetical protein
MTIDRMDLKALIEKAPDADFLREMIEVISNRLMEMEVEGLTGAAHGERSANRTNQRVDAQHRYAMTAIASAPGKPVSAPSTSPSPSFARVAIFRASWSRGAPPRRRSLLSFRKPMSKAYQRVPSTIWSRPWA